MARFQVILEMDERVKSRAEKAAALLGQSTLEAYLVRLIDEDSTRVIEAFHRLSLQSGEEEAFMERCRRSGRS